MMDGSDSQLMERFRQLVRREHEIGAPMGNSTPNHSIAPGGSNSLLATPEQGSSRVEESAVDQTYVTGLTTNLSLLEVFKQDHRLRRALVLTLVCVASLSCVILALTLKINYLQNELVASQELCPVPVSIMAEASVTVEFSATASQSSTEPLTDVWPTTTSPLPVPKFSGRKNIKWNSRW